MVDRAAGLRLAVVSRRVHPAHGPGGLERHVHDQIVHLAGAGVQVDLYTELPRDRARAAALEATMPVSVRTHWIRPGALPFGGTRGTVVLDRVTNYPRWARRVARAVRREPDVLHVHGLAGLGFAERRHAFACPMVLTTHGMEEFHAPGLKGVAYRSFRRGIRRIAAASHAVVVTDDVMLPMVRRELGVEPAKLVVIPNAIDPERCTRVADRGRAHSLLAGLGARGASPLLVSVGRVAPNKGFTALVEALAATRAELPAGWRWILVGDGPERSAVAAAVARAGLDDRCHLVGAVDDGVKHGLLATADLFVHPTLYEGSSLVTLEAMAHRLPVVATRAGGLPDKVRDGETGFLVNPGDVAQLGAALVRATATDSAALGAGGRLLLDARFSWAVVAPLYQRLYAGLLAG